MNDQIVTTIDRPQEASAPAPKVSLSDIQSIFNAADGQHTAINIGNDGSLSVGGADTNTGTSLRKRRAWY